MQNGVQIGILFLRQQLWGLQKEASICVLWERSFLSPFGLFVNQEGPTGPRTKLRSSVRVAPS